MCISDGVLRAKLDGEIEPAEIFGIGAHLAGCADCRSRLQLLDVRASRVQHLLSTLESQAALPNTIAALADFRRREHPAHPAVLFLFPTLEEPWYRSLACQVRELLRREPEPALDVTSKPLPVKDIWDEYRYTRQAAASSLLAHLAMLAILVTAFVNPQVRELTKRTVTLILPSDLSQYLPIAKPSAKPMGGGGGGGDRNPLPASRGKLPKFSMEQFTPPGTRAANENPKLIMDPTVIVPPDLQLPQFNMAQLGDPLGRVGPLSNGPGSGGGIGSGSDGGVGSGTGPGVGPGAGGGVGGGRFRVGGGVSSPQVIHRVDPEYSEEARKAKHQGTVELYVEIEPDGLAHKIVVYRALGLGLDEEAVKAVRQWRFKPAMKDGKPVTVGALVTVHFRLL